MGIAQIQKKINNAKHLDFGVIFNNCIELFKKVWVQGFVILLLSMVISGVLVFALYIPLIFLGFSFGAFAQTFSENSFGLGIFASLTGLLFFVLILLMLVAVMTVTMALHASFYRIIKFKDYNEMGNEDYFYFLKKAYLKKTAALAVVNFLIAILFAMLCGLPLIYAIVPLSLLPVIYAFNPGLSVSDIVKLSFQLGTKKWGITFALLIVTGLLAYFVGLFMCFIGVYFTISFIYLPPYFIYKNVVGFNSDDDAVDFDTGFNVKQIQ